MLKKEKELLEVRLFIKPITKECLEEERQLMLVEELMLTTLVAEAAEMQELMLGIMVLEIQISVMPITLLHGI